MAKPTATKHYDKVVYVDRYVVTRLQTVNYDQETSDEDVEEIGNEGIVETIVNTDIPTTVTLNTNDWGTTDFLCQVMGERASTGSVYDTTGANQNSWTVSSSDAKFQNSDFIIRTRNNDSGYLERTAWLPSCYLTSINWSYSVDGSASENLTFRGDTDRYFIGEYKQTSADIGTYATGTSFSTNIDEGTGTYDGLYVTIDGIIYAFTGNFTWSGTTVTVTGGSIPALTADSRLRLIYFDTTATATEAFTALDTSGLGAIKGDYIVIELSDASIVDGTTKTLRLQSVDVNASITREDINEIGTTQAIGRPLSKQEVTVDATFLETDLENFAYMLGKTTSEWSNRETTGLELKLQDSIGNQNELQVRVYDGPNQGTLLKTLTVNNLKITRAPFSQDVAGNGQYTMSLKGDNWQWVGAGVGGNLTGSYPTQWITT